LLDLLAEFLGFVGALLEEDAAGDKAAAAAKDHDEENDEDGDKPAGHAALGSGWLGRSGWRDGAGHDVSLSLLVV
jgi:hypothetical protein